MSIQYSGGTYVNTTFATTAKTDLISSLQTQLTNAGWAAVSGAGTTNLLMQTATAAGSNNAGRVRFIDNGGTGIQVILENVSGSVKQTPSVNTGGTLKPGPTYQILATHYQFFVFPSTGQAAAGQFVCAGILYVPTFLQGVITEAFYMASNSQNDADTSNPPYSCWRVSVSQLQNTTGQGPGNHATIVNGNLHDHSNNAGVQVADLATLVPRNSYTSNYGGSTFTPGYRWHDLSLQISEVLVAFGNANSSDEPLLRGQLYDVCFISDVFAQNATTSFTDGGAAHNFFCLSSCPGSSSVTHGSLFVATS